MTKVKNAKLKVRFKTRIEPVHSTGSKKKPILEKMTNLLLTEREGRTGEYWPEVVAVRTERSEVRTKTTEGQYSPVRLEQARLVSSLLYGTRVMLVSSYDHFHGNGPYGKIPTKKEPIRTPGFTPRLPCHIINVDIFMTEERHNTCNWCSMCEVSVTVKFYFQC